MPESGGNVNITGSAERSQMENKNSLESWVKGHPCDVVTKSLVIRCPCPGALWEPELENDGLLIGLSRLSRPPGVQAAAWVKVAAVNKLHNDSQ